MQPTPGPARPADAKPLTTDELLEALHKKFGENFSASKSGRHQADAAEAQARKISEVAQELFARTAPDSHQSLLATYLDEVFADAICALFLASCGLNVPARMLLRRSLELGVVVVAYWDDPASFYQWRDHDCDVRFSTLIAQLTREGYLTLLAKVNAGTRIDEKAVFGGLAALYGDLSDVVHPKPHNFATGGKRNYSFESDEFSCTVALAERVYRAVLGTLRARFPDLKA